MVVDAGWSGPSDGEAVTVAPAIGALVESRMVPCTLALAGAVCAAALLANEG